MILDCVRSGFGFWGIYFGINGSGVGIFSNVRGLGIEWGYDAFHIPINKLGFLDYAWDFDPSRSFRIDFWYVGEWDPGWKWILVPYWMIISSLWLGFLLHHQVRKRFPRRSIAN